FPLVEKRVTRWERAAGVPTVLTYHMDADFHGATGIPGAGLITRAYRRFSAHPALDACDIVVSNSHGYAKVSPVLSRHLDKVRVVYKGVDPSRLGVVPGDRSVPPRAEPGERLLPGSSPSEKRVVFVGRLVPYKGIGILLDAVRALRAELPNLKLYVAGTGPLSASLRETVEREGLTQSVRFLGFVPDEQIGTLYRSADVVACPSIGLMESTATTLEEAAACGTMTLGSSLSGTDETVPADGTHGLLSPPGDAKALAAALHRLLNQPRPTERFRFRTGDDTANDYLALFAELGVGPGSLARH
ncbi:MAG: glycosyltransferase family 4 protein, partial [Thermoplasmata archaeon]|nr:glycosyltransferase family 4 protein [Thermoplasmata archaeon]